MRTSDKGIELIKRNEGCRLDAYLDEIASPPVWTIGYGETGPGITEGLSITQDEAEERLIKRIEEKEEPELESELDDADTTQTQYDAMVSLRWNIGGGGFRLSTVLRKHKSGEYDEAAGAFLMWNRAGGRVIAALTRRRSEEAGLYRQPSDLILP